MRLAPMILPALGLLMLGGLAEASYRPESAEASAAVAIQATPRFVWASGANGVQYYRTGTTAAAPRTARTSAARPRTVGPGVRDWTTGQRLGSHKPWLQSRG